MKLSVKLLFQSHDTINVPMIITYFIQILITYCVIFIICELGERVTNEFDDVDNVVCELNWYLFPLNIQKMLPIAMIGTVKPVIIRGYGNCMSTREAFKNVSSKAICT